MRNKPEFRWSPALATSLGAAAMAVASTACAVIFTVNRTLDQPDDLTIPRTCHTAANTCTLRRSCRRTVRAAPARRSCCRRAPTRSRFPASVGDEETNGNLYLTTPWSGSPLIAVNGSGAGTTNIDDNQLGATTRTADESTTLGR